MKKYGVKLPIAGHVYLEVEADTEEAAIDKALGENITLDYIEEWEVLRQFNRGNICYCPEPWEAEAELIDDDEVA